MMKKIKILVVDDDEDDYVLLKSYFNEIATYDIELAWTPKYNNALSEMVTNKYDLYFIDYLMGQHTGLELLESAISGGCTKPTIILTGKGSYKIDVKAMELGASDFMVKAEVNTEKLERSIRYTLERSDSLRALTESENKYRTIFESSRDMIYITDENGKFLEVNDSVTRIFGYKISEIMEKSVAVLYQNDEDREKLLSAIKLTGSIYNYEVVLKDINNDKKYCLISATMQNLESGKFIIRGIIHDITRRRKIERDLAMAEKLALTGRVSRMLAHEVRNPLTNITLTVEQLEYEVANAEFELYFSMIRRNCNRINDLINELLLSTRPQEVVKGKFSIHKILDDALALAMDRAKLKNVKITRQYTKNLCDVMVDEVKFRTAILNILMNAIEAVHPEGGNIQVRTNNKDNRCIIEIIDNGIGVPPENISKLFEPYFTAKEGGVGLGLATTHNIIQSHEGTIDVESEVGKGTKLIIGINI